MPKKDTDPRITAAKALIKEKLANGKIPLANLPVGPTHVWNDHPSFAEFWDYKSFRNFLGYARRATKNSVSVADADLRRAEKDRRLFPIKTLSEGGNRRWRDSDAQRFLKQDMDDGKHCLMAPKLLYKTRAAYYDFFPLKQFREHIHQEIRKRKFVAYVKEKADRKKQKVQMQGEGVGRNNTEQQDE